MVFLHLQQINYAQSEKIRVKKTSYIYHNEGGFDYSIN